MPLVITEVVLALELIKNISDRYLQIRSHSVVVNRYSMIKVVISITLIAREPTVFDRTTNIR